MNAMLFIRTMECSCMNAMLFIRTMECSCMNAMLFIRTMECSCMNANVIYQNYGMFLYECNVTNSVPEDGIFKMGWEILTGVLDAPFCKTLSLVQ